MDCTLMIRNLSEYKRMQKVVDKLAVLDKRTVAQERYLDTLTVLMEDYEEEHVRLDLPKDPVAILKYLLSENDLSTRDLEKFLGKILGQPQLGSKILRKERALSKQHILKLSSYFNVAPTLFLH